MNLTLEPSNFNQQVGGNLRGLRAVAGLTQTDLAEAMSARGCSWQQQTVLRIEKGARPLKFEEADALAAVLGCTLEEVRSYDHVAAAGLELRRVQERIRELESQRNQIENWLDEGREREQELKSIMDGSNG